MDDANLIACLFPANKDPLGYSRDAICSSGNEERRLPAQQKAGGAGQGFVVGTDASSCDIIVPNLKGISARHCYFTFNANRQFIVDDVSHNGTSVTYNDKGKGKRRHFRWILGGDEELKDEEIVVEIHPFVRFQIIVSHHRTGLYRDNVNQFLQEAAASDELRVGGLGIQSKFPTATQSGERTPSHDPIYLPRGILGKGAFGVVNRVWDVSTGIMYASKKFLNITKSDWRKEASVMKRVSHPHIVELVHVFDTPSPRLILEYLPFGNLEDQNAKQRISEREALTSLFQSLSALKCLHTAGIVHRDIKPANMLLKSRDPWHLKLADFGLSKTDTSLTTVCGTYIYTAVEVFECFKYTSACDIWSLGVVIFEFVYGLPRHDGIEKGRSWCEKIIRKLHDWDSDPLINFLSNNMLIMEPEWRLSAEDCHEEALRLPPPSSKRIPTPTPASYINENRPAVTEQTVDPNLRDSLQLENSINSFASSEIRKYIRSNIGHANSNASTIILEKRKRLMPSSTSSSASTRGATKRRGRTTVAANSGGRSQPSVLEAQRGEIVGRPWTRSDAELAANLQQANREVEGF